MEKDAYLSRQHKTVAGTALAHRSARQGKGESQFWEICWGQWGEERVIYIRWCWGATRPRLIVILQLCESD